MRGYSIGLVSIAGLVFLLGPVNAARSDVFCADVYGTGATMDDYLRTVPGGGQPGGPAYAFRMGMYEITNAQFAAFLNDAQLDGGATGKGSNMYFQDDGRVRAAPGGPTLFRGWTEPSSWPVRYDVSTPLGQRWAVDLVNGMDMSSHPVWNVTWYGAAKFANWLTLDQGLPSDQRTYAEGPAAADWHPATISTADWQTRDLNSAERQALVDNYRGFRLPMDDQASTASAFNEFYKAAAWDPDDQVNHAYGFGRDTIDYMDANGAGLRPWWELLPDDPFEAGIDPDTTPVGFYDGTLWQRSDWNWPDQTADFDTFQTRANENAYGIYDLSGNLDEWAQDRWSDSDHRHAIRGDCWSGIEELSKRSLSSPEVGWEYLGFRVVQVPEPATVVLLVIAGACIIRRADRG